MEITGKVYEPYREWIMNNHILIAGSSGSGKSTLIDGLIHAALFTNNSYFILIDPKRLALKKYRNMKNLMARVTETDEAIQVLQKTIQMMENRYEDMENRDLDVCDKPHIFVIVDEYADLMLTSGKVVTPLIQRIAQLGRQANIHLVIATQTVLATIISTPIRANFDCIIALRTATANQSRVILGENGAEKLPRHGTGIVSTPEGMYRYKLPMVPKEELERVIQAFNK